MQIRVANRQDEPSVRAIVNEVRAQRGEPAIELTGTDCDLNNIDQHYFWYDGIFLVAEEEGEIVGLIGARRGSSEDTLELLRLAVSPKLQDKGVASKLVDRVIYFAGNLEYERVLMHPSRQHLDPASPIAPFAVDAQAADQWVASIARRERCGLRS